MNATALTPISSAPPLDTRVMHWPGEGLIARRCPVCADTQSHPIVLRPDGLMVVHCALCGMAYLPKVPSEQQLAQFYSRYSAEHQTWQSSKSPSAALAAAGRRRDGNGLIREIAARRTLAGRSVLEIGCARGSFLLDARGAGAIVAGVEIDQLSRGFVRDLGIACYGSLDEAARQGSYDIVVALNVIEHLPEPRRWLQQVAALLKPGGLLALWTPNGGQAADFGAGWVGFRVDLDHLNYFSKSTLARMLLDCDLWTEATWEFSNANLAAFTGAKSASSWFDRLRRRWRTPVQTWALPPGGGGYTLALLAGKPSAESK